MANSDVLTRSRSAVARTGPRLAALPPIVWLLSSVTSVLIVCAARIVRTPSFFFWDDTQLGAFGQWYGLGSRLVNGEFVFLSPGAWQGGNYLAEGQWGLWNPLTWLIAVGTQVTDNPAGYATVIKLVFLVLLCVGAYLLAREYGAKPWWAAVAGFAASLGGQTIYLDAPSWVTGLQNTALFAFSWWALKRHVERGRSPIPFFVCSYLLITFGYVFGVIQLAVLLLAFACIGLATRSGVRFARTMFVGAFAALITVFVFLPGLLTSPVTRRSGAGIANDLFLNMDLGDLAASPIATAVTSVRGYWGDIVPVPLQYVSWLIPLVVLFLPVTRSTLRALIVPAVVLGFTLLFVLGPSVIGPLRYPARMMPYAVLAIAICFAVVASRPRDPIPSRKKVVAAVALTCAAGWFGWAAQPDSYGWVIAAVIIQAGLVLLIFWPWRDRPPLSASPAAAAAALLVGSLIVLAPQVVKYPTSPLGDFRVPNSVSALAGVGDDIQNGAITVGDVYSLQSDPKAYSESLLANLWYLTGKDVASVYTVLPFTAFADELCMDLRGATCPEALDTLLASEGEVADDLSLNTIVVIKGEGLTELPELPTGWSAEERQFTWLITRDTVVPPAGGVLRTSSGVEVEVVSRNDTEVVMRVIAVPTTGGDVIFSRLAWPGYSTSAGSIGDPERGYLLTVNLDGSEQGTLVTVSFLPPGWALEVAALAIAAVLAFVVSLAHHLRRRGRQSAG